MSVLVFCESLFEVCTPIPGFYAAANDLEVAGIPTLVVDYFSAFEFADLNRVLANLAKPSVKVVVIHLNLPPPQGGSYYDQAKDTRRLADINDRIAVVRRALPDATLVAAGWLAGNQLFTKKNFPDIDFFYTNGYDVCPAVVPIHAGEPVVADSDGILDERYSILKERSRLPVNYALNTFFQGNSAYIMKQTDRCIAHCFACPLEHDCQRVKVMTWADRKHELLPGFSLDLVRDSHEAGVRNWFIADFDFSGKLDSVLDVAALRPRLPADVRFFTALRLEALVREPRIAQSLAAAGFAGAFLAVHSLNDANLGAMEASYRSTREALAWLRSVVGPDFFIQAFFTAGMPFDTLDSLLADAAFLLSEEGRKLVDCFAYNEPFIAHQSPIGQKYYRHPVAGKLWQNGVLYWETEHLNPMQVRHALSEIQALQRQKNWVYGLWPQTASILGELLSSANTGFSLERGFELVRKAGPDSGHQLAGARDELARRQGQYVARNADVLSKVECDDRGRYFLG